LIAEKVIRQPQYQSRYTLSGLCREIARQFKQVYFGGKLNTMAQITIIANKGIESFASLSGTRQKAARPSCSRYV